MSPLCNWSLLAPQFWLVHWMHSSTGSIEACVMLQQFTPVVCTAAWMTPRTVAARMSFGRLGESSVHPWLFAAPFRAWPGNL